MFIWWNRQQFVLYWQAQWNAIYLITLTCDEICAIRKWWFVLYCSHKRRNWLGLHLRERWSDRATMHECNISSCANNEHGRLRVMLQYFIWNLVLMYMYLPIPSVRGSLVYHSDHSWQSHWLLLRQRVNLKICLLVYKWLTSSPLRTSCR